MASSASAVSSTDYSDVCDDLNANQAMYRFLRQQEKLLSESLQSPWRVHHAQNWRAAFDGAVERRGDGMREGLRRLRKLVYVQTCEHVISGGRAFVETSLQSATEFLEQCARAVRETKKYQNSEALAKAPLASEDEGFDTVFEVDECDCLDKAQQLLDVGHRVAVLNMASARHPGGGVVGGAGAQEENLFRRSAYFMALLDPADLDHDRRWRYPIAEEGAVYSPGVPVVRGNEALGYPFLEKPFLVDFVAVAALHHPRLRGQELAEARDIHVMKAKMRTILRVCLEHDRTALVLSAFGCGAYCCPPRHVARLFHEVFAEPEFARRFQHVCFAIIEDHNAYKPHNPDGNVKPFRDVFCE